MDDNQIIGLYFSRDQRAIEETGLKYGKLCRTVANNLLKNPEDSEECVNDTYLALWNSIPPESPRNFAAYICRIARNLSLKKLEYGSAQKRSAGAAVSFSELESLLPDSAFAPDRSETEVSDLISRFLRTEKELHRSVFIRKYWYFDSVGDISKRYSLSESKVKSILFRSRKRLREFLLKEGVEL